MLGKIASNAGQHHRYWRDINSILQDPFKSKTKRIYALHEAGIGLAASFNFDFGGHRGIVMYLARSTANVHQLSVTENMIFLQRSSDLIGATVAMNDARRASKVFKQKVTKSNFKMIRDYLRLSVAFSFHGKSKRQINDEKNTRNSFTRFGSFLLNSNDVDEKKFRRSLTDLSNFLSKLMNDSYMAQYYSRWIHKCKGGNMQIPPSMNLSQSVWTFIGCFVGFSALFVINDCAKYFSNGKYKLMYVWLEATMSFMLK